MRLRSITWKRDPYNIFDRMRDEPECAYNAIERAHGAIEHKGVYRWNIHWAPWADRHPHNGEKT